MGKVTTKQVMERIGALIRDIESDKSKERLLLRARDTEVLFVEYAMNNCTKECHRSYAVCYACTANYLGYTGTGTMYENKNDKREW